MFEAGYGFKNFGQFNAAVNNAQNHSLSFEQLKTLMTGVSVDSAGVVLYANRNPDGTVTMVPLDSGHESGADDEPRTGEEDHRDHGRNRTTARRRR